VDNRTSALISAPTSSGKTFISFYAMEKVLRASKDMDDYQGVDADSQVVIYVSPTKALVNQMEAEMYARFRKRYSKNASTALVGVFTQDYRTNPLTCQVLITVPSCLEVLLLSPHNEEWKRRVKWVVFDEVHCISMGNGQAWERLLQMIECPFLALSATMGNTTEFYTWLSRLEESRKRPKPVFIQHRQRWNDLDLWVYHMEKHCLVPMNPLGLLDADTLSMQGKCPDELKLLPEHCIQTFELLRKLTGEQPSEAVRAVLARMDPQAHAGYLNQRSRVTMNGAEKYETQVKAAVEALASASPALLEQLLAALRGNIASAALPTAFEELADGGHLRAAIRHLENETPSKLPAICFHLDVAGIHVLVEALTQAMLREQEDGELKKKRFKEWDDPAARQRALDEINRATEMTAMNIARKLAEEALDDLKRTDPSTKTTLDEIVKEIYPAELAKRQQKIEAPYCIGGKAVPMEDIIAAFNNKLSEKQLADLMQQDPFYQALRRGIGMHYKELSIKQRKAVEHLFRHKRLSVVFATSTLALGISMPCRSVIFVGDSPLLDCQSYLQMAGRAGRRGFDKRGHVIFYGLGLNKTRRLLTSPLRNMSANVPLDVSTTTRALMCYQSTKKDDRRQAAIEQVWRLTCLPFYAVQEPMYELLSSLYSRGALELMVRSHFMVYDRPQRGALGPADEGKGATLVDQTDALFEAQTAEAEEGPGETGADDWDDLLASSDEEATARLVTAYEEMLPATERLVAHHLRRRLLTRAASRVSEELAADDDGLGPPP
jgi:superfamily II DNA or RNA helicase